MKDFIVWCGNGPWCWRTRLILSACLLGGHQHLQNSLGHCCSELLPPTRPYRQMATPGFEAESSAQAAVAAVGFPDLPRDP